MENFAGLLLRPTISALTYLACFTVTFNIGCNTTANADTELSSISDSAAGELFETIDGIPTLRVFSMITGTAILPDLNDRATIVRFDYSACIDREFGHTVKIYGNMAILRINWATGDNCALGEEPTSRVGEVLIPASTLSANIVILNPVRNMRAP